MGSEDEASSIFNLSRSRLSGSQEKALRLSLVDFPVQFSCEWTVEGGERWKEVDGGVVRKKK